MIPWLLGSVAATHSRELFTLTVLVVALGIAVGSAVFSACRWPSARSLPGWSSADRTSACGPPPEALPMRDAFAVLFFVSVGMLFDPRDLSEHFGATAATLAIVLIGKPLAALVIVLAMSGRRRWPSRWRPRSRKLASSRSCSPRLGKSLGLLPATAVNAIVAASILSIAVNPLVYRFADRVSAWFVRRFQRPSPTAIAGSGRAPSQSRPSSRNRRWLRPRRPDLEPALAGNEIEPTIVELNLDTVKRLADAGFPVVYGDAAHSDTLKAAGIADGAA